MRGNRPDSRRRRQGERSGGDGKVWGIKKVEEEERVVEKKGNGKWEKGKK